MQFRAGCGVTLSTEREQFRTELLNHGRSDLTVRTYEYRLQQFEERLAAYEISIERVTVDVLEQWIADQRAQGLAAKTIRSNVDAVRSFFAWLAMKGRIEKDPLQSMWPINVPKKLPRVLQVVEVEQLIAAAGDRRARAIAEFFYACGLRVAELVGCNVQDLDLAGPQVLVRGKGDRERYVPITAVAVRALQDWMKERDLEISAWEALRTRAGELHRRGFTYRQIGEAMGVSAPVALKYVAQSKSGFKDKDALFVGRQGRLDARQIRRILRKMAKDAGLLKRVHPHILRHSFATHLRENGVELDIIQELLGHESPSTTRVYAHVARKQIREAYERGHPRGELMHGGAPESVL